jgi:hypothetical protein
MSTKAKLLESVSPSIFEHLVIHLLQLESGHTARWHHIGGAGDGGVDGMALSHDGKIASVLQCKWHSNENAKTLINGMLAIRQKWPDCEIVVAVFLEGRPNIGQLPPRTRYIGLSEIVMLIERFRDQMPFALTLGITGTSE